MNKNIVIVHYNTPELTYATIQVFVNLLTV